MEDKKSNLAFSADLTKTQELIQVMMEGRVNVISRNGNGRRMREIEAEREEGETDWEEFRSWIKIGEGLISCSY